MSQQAPSVRANQIATQTEGNNVIEQLRDRVKHVEAEVTKLWKALTAVSAIVPDIPQLQEEAHTPQQPGKSHST